MAAQVDDGPLSLPAVSAPAWIKSSLEVKEGRDPLGLQTTTQDRLMPVLLPGILEQTRRARYFSFYAFLLSEYRMRRLPPDGKSLWAFIKRREWEYGLAVLRCPHGCQSAPIGARRLRAVAQCAGPFPRGESVESPMGGYGQGYRSPLADLGIVAKAGTFLGDQPIPIDVLYDSDRAHLLADTFRAAVVHTAYYQRAMLTSGDLPAEVIAEYAAAACLCQLRERPAERTAVQEALFGTDPPGPGPAGTDANDAAPFDGVPAADAGWHRRAAAQRRRSVAHYLTILRADPEVIVSESAYREMMWSSPRPQSEADRLVAGQWAALIAKDVWQEAICSVWSEFCRTGLARTRQLGRGLTWHEARALAGDLPGETLAAEADEPARSLAERLAEGTLVVDDGAGDRLDVTRAELEQLRQWTSQRDTAMSGLVVLLELARRMDDRSGAGWDHAATARSAWQPSVAAVAAGLRAHLAQGPTIAETLWWLVSRFVLPVHERIAYSKLPEFTFRFRWEEGLLRFYDLGVERFPLASIRREPLALLTWDLGFWTETDGDQIAELTDRGTAFLREAVA
jgi:hypothetical protein